MSPFVFGKSRWARSRSLCVGLSIVAMFGAACGSSGSSDAVSTSSESAVESGTDDGNTESYRDAESPLAAYMGFDFTDSDAMVEQERVLEQKVKECMQSQGFEYNVASSENLEIFEDMEDFGTEEYAAEHGYGLAESILAFPGFDAEDGAFTNPNEAILSGMSDTERESWEVALYGPPITESQAEDEEFSYEPQGCYGEAAEEVYGDFAVFEELAPAFEAMDAAFTSDPRVVEINEKWASCMSEAGYSFDDPDDAYMAVSEKIDAAMTSMPGVSEEPMSEAGMEEGMEEAPADGSPPEGPPGFDPELTAKIDEIKTEEIAIATADAACQGEDRDKMMEIQREYELKFIEDNKAALDQANS